MPDNHKEINLQNLLAGREKMLEITQAELEILRDAVDAIVDSERRNHPEKTNDFWEQFHVTVLAMVIERHEEIFA